RTHEAAHGHDPWATLGKRRSDRGSPSGPRVTPVGSFGGFGAIDSSSGRFTHRLLRCPKSVPPRCHPRACGDLCLLLQGITEVPADAAMTRWKANEKRLNTERETCRPQPAAV